MLPVALSCEKSAPGVDPLSSMNVVVVLAESIEKPPSTASVVAPVLVELVPSKRLPFVIVSGPVFRVWVGH